MLNPETNFTVPGGGFVVNCGELDAAGTDGIINPNDCALVSPLVQARCGCSPVGYTCNICGGDDSSSSNGLLSVSVGNATFVPGDAMTCAEAETAGLAGELDPVRCGIYSPLARLSCGCTEGGATDAPSIEEDTSSTSSSAAPSAAATATGLPQTNGPEEQPSSSITEAPVVTPGATPGTMAPDAVTDPSSVDIDVDDDVPTPAPVSVSVATTEVPDTTSPPASNSSSSGSSVDGVEGSGQESSDSAEAAVSMIVVPCLVAMVVALLA